MARWLQCHSSSQPWF